MKKALLIALTLMPLTAMAQNDGWKVPVTEVAAAPATKKEAAKAQENEYKYAEYLGEDCVPLVDGKVEWQYDIELPGRSADDLYKATLDILTRMTSEENQLERSKVALVNPQQHSLIATMQEWLVFSSSALTLDRTKFNYVLQADCTDGHLQLRLGHITYNYEAQRDTYNYKAEEWITDEFAVNKKRTRLYPIAGKFRRKTIDRKNEIFENIKGKIALR